MKKIVLQFSVIVILFFATWFGLRQIDWVSVFNVQEATKSTEEKLGDLFWKMFSKTENEIQSTTIQNSIDTLVTHICKNNSIDRSKIKIHILRNEEINAFTLPNNHLVIYSGLIKSSENEAELLGVISHELAHMEKNHVMKKLMKEVGLSVLISMTTNNAGGEIIKKTAKMLSSSAYDRDLETEADLTAVEYLLNSNIDPEPFANFLYRLSDEEKNIPNQVYWISTHPESKERAERIIESLKHKSITKGSVLTKEKWDLLKSKLDDKK